MLDSYSPLKFATESDKDAFEFQWSHPDEAYLQRLREDYDLSAVVADVTSDYEKIRAVRGWVSNLWTHDGRNEPSQNDPLTILSEAERGRSFRCVEYSIVIAGVLSALGIPARVMSLKTQDVQTREVSASHVVTEAYLQDAHKWIFVDGQFDVTPFLQAQPLSAVELQHAIASQWKRIEIDTSSDTQKTDYLRWLAPYLFYFDVPLDNRITPQNSLWSLDNIDHLMLVPLGASKPTVFQRKWSLKGMNYTHSLDSFYIDMKQAQTLASVHSRRS